jgi:hypothetical protein
MASHPRLMRAPLRQRGIFVLESAAATVVFAIVSIIVTDVLRHLFP